MPWHVDWALVTEARTLARGSSKALCLDDSESPSYIVEVPTPTLREAVVLPVQLEMTWRSGESKLQLHRPLTIFSRNPLSIRQTFLKNAHIKLFDLEGETAELLDKYEIPYTRLPNLSSVDRATDGVVLVGEGTSFLRQRGLQEILMKTAQRGVSVLCLAPADGTITLAAGPNDLSTRPNMLTLERRDVVRRYNKRFDLLSPVTHLSFEARRNEVLLRMSENSREWSWLQMQFPAEKPVSPRSRLIVSGLGIVSHWEVSPVPRYLFLSLLEELTPAQPAQEKNDEYASR